MAIDLQNGYNDAYSKLQAYKTFLESKKSIKDALENKGNQFQPAAKNSTFQIDQAELQNKIKQQVKSQFEQLIGLVLANKGSGLSTVTFLISKFVRAIKILKTKLLEILVEEIVKALGCDLEQTYLAGEYYIKLCTIDIFKILQEDPSSKVGKLLYEPREYVPTDARKSVNRMLWRLIQSETELHSQLYSGLPYLGFSTTGLFDIRYTQIDPSGDASGWFVVTLLDRPDGQPNKVSQFLVDYFKTINLIDVKALTTALVEAVLGVVSVELRYGTVTLDDNTKFGLLVQRILGLCFDNEQEISIAGQSKTPVLDDTTESFFELTNLDFSIVEQRTAEITEGVVTFDTCDNVKLPINSTVILDIIEETIGFNEDIGAMENALEQISLSLSTNPEWQASFPFPDQLKITLDFNFVAKIPKAIINQLLTPKVILPFLTMVKALGIDYDDSLCGPRNFLRQNRRFVTGLMSKIGAFFIEILFNEIKKDIRRLVRAIITDINSAELNATYVMIETLVNIALKIIAFVKDYRRCKSVLDAILQLFSLIQRVSRPKIPPPLMLFASALPGYSSDRAFIGAIETMQKLGLPTGPLPDGSPNLGLQAMYAQIQAQDLEQKQNGKTEGALKLPPPYGLIQTIGKGV
jgi:hypothetical protein